MDLKNMTMDDLKQKLSGIDKKTLIKFGIGIGSVIVFLIIYYTILSPIVDKKRAQLNDMQKKQTEINEMNKVISSSKAKIKKLTPQYENFSTLFHSKAEVEGLYETLSQFAGMNNLIISKIEKGKPVAVSKVAAMASTEKKKKKKKKKKVDTTKKQNIAYYRIPVNFQIKGNFLGYIKFKRAVSRQNKMLNFDKETISIVQNDATGAIVAKGELTIVGLPDEFF